MKKILMVMMIVAVMMFMSVPAMAEINLLGGQATVELGVSKLFSVSHSLNMGELDSKIDSITLTSPRDQVLFRFEGRWQYDKFFVSLRDYAFTGNILTKDGDQSWGVSKNLFIGSAGYMITKNLGIQGGYASWMSRAGMVKTVNPYVFTEAFVRF